MSSPPRWATRLLEKGLDHRYRDQVLGDLAEEFRHRGGGSGARLWYVREALGVTCRAFAAGRVEELIGDLGWAVRQSARHPAFSAVSIAALSLGVGVNVAMFALADQVLLTPLPYPQPERLGIVTNDHTGSATGGFGVSWANMVEVRAANRSIDDLSLFLDWRDVVYAGADEAQLLPAAFVDDRYFSLLGLETAHGRLIGAHENAVNLGERVVVLGAGAWRRVFGADPSVVGSVIRLNGLPYEVVGVMADDRGDLRHRWQVAQVGVYLPLFAAEELFGIELDQERRYRVLNALVRLRGGVDTSAAQADLRALSAALAEEHAEFNEGFSYRLQALEDALFESLQGPTRALLAGSTAVFLLVVVNLVGLVLIRAAGRRAEFAMRRALGARASRLARQLITESLLLSIAAGGVGVLLAAWVIGWIGSSEAIALPSFAALRLDGRAAFASVLLTIIAGVVLGLAPALNLARGVDDGSLACGWRGSERRATVRFRHALVAVEVALACILLVGAGLLLLSFVGLRDTGYGFATDDLLLVPIDATATERRDERLLQLADELERRAAALPGAAEAFIWSPNRLGHGNQVEIVTREGRFLDHHEERVEASEHAIHPGTLRKLGIPLLGGRDVSGNDDATSPRVVIVSRTLADELWPGADPLGQRLETIRDGELMQAEVIGVAADSRHRTRLIDPFGPQRDLFYPFAQTPWSQMTVAIRFDPGIDLAALATAARRMVRDVDADIPVFDVETMAEQMRSEEARSRVTALLVTGYAVLALALAALGLYGVLSYLVRSRRLEVGVRMALGAAPVVVRRDVVRRGFVAVVGGCLVGMVASLAVGRALASVLYGVSPFHPLPYAAVLLILGAVGLAALWLPAVRASRTDPVQALREA